MGNNAQLQAHRLEKEKQVKKMMMLLRNPRTAANQRAIHLCQMSIASAETNIEKCERLSKYHDQKAEEWASRQPNNGAAAGGARAEATTAADARADAAAARVNKAAARGTTAAVNMAACAATAESMQTQAKLAADIDSRRSMIEKTDAGRAERSRQIIVSSVLCLNERVRLCKELTKLEIDVVQQGDTVVKQGLMRVLQDKIKVNEAAIVTHKNMPAADVVRLAEMRQSLQVREDQLRVLQAAR